MRAAIMMMNSDILRRLSAGLRVVRQKIAANEADLGQREAFVASQLLGGGFGLLAVLSYIAIVGIPTGGAALVLFWFLSPFLVGALAIFNISLVWCHAFSILNLAAMISIAAALTGGHSSFVLPWLLVLPIEAALSQDRRVVLFGIGMAGASLIGLMGLQQAELLPLSLVDVTGSAIPHALGLVTALIYAGGLAFGFQNLYLVASKAAVKKQDRCDMLAENATDLITEHGADGRITFATKASARIFGIEPDQLLDEAPSSLAHADDAKSVRAAFARATYRGEDVSIEYRIRRGDGNYLWVETRCCPMERINNSDAMPAHSCVAITRDISDRKLYELALVAAKNDAEAANEAKSRFLANMSHELRTPLNAVIGFAEMVQSEIYGSVGDRRYADYAGYIHDSGTHLLDLINDLLDVSKIEAGKFKLAPELVSVPKLVDECEELLSVSAREAGVKLEIDVTPIPELVWADKRSLKQILINLMSNGIKFTPQEGVVRVTSFSQPSSYHLIVSDTGVGIANKDLTRIGKPFEQVGDFYVRNKPGTGLGLAVVKSLTELHEGKVEIRSELGAGTQVEVILPRIDAGHAANDVVAIDQQLRGAA